MTRSTALYRNKPALDSRLKELPARPGVYRFLDATGAIVYIGKSVCLRDRVRSYFTGRADCKKVRRLRQEIAGIEWGSSSRMIDGATVDHFDIGLRAATDNRALAKNEVASGIPPSDLAPQSVVSPVSAAGEEQWIELKIGKSADSLLAQEVAAQHDELARVIEQVRHKLRKEQALFAQVRQANHEQAAISPLQTQQLADARNLNEQATEALAQIADKLQSVAELSLMIPLGTAAPDFALPDVVSGDVLSRDAIARGRPLLVVPGIRPTGAATHDQQRTGSARDAVHAGASLVVVGRPLREAADPVAAADALAREMET